VSRKQNDNYPSEPALIHELMSRVDISGHVFEPAAGAGGLSSPLKQAGLRVSTNDIAHGIVYWDCPTCGAANEAPIYGGDIDAQPCRSCKVPHHDVTVVANRTDTVDFDCDYHEDAASPRIWTGIGGYEWVITNPPYKYLDVFLQHALQYADVGVAMLLRVTAIEPAITQRIRGDLLIEYADNMRYLMPVSAPRPSFTGDKKTDSVTTAWFVWQKNFSWFELGLEPPFQFITNWKEAFNGVSKKCTSCEAQVPIDKFRVLEQQHRYRSSWCKECESKRNRKYYENNRESILKKARQRKMAKQLGDNNV
jgi:hypothetical protein